MILSGRAARIQELEYSRKNLLEKKGGLENQKSEPGSPKERY